MGCPMSHQRRDDEYNLRNVQAASYTLVGKVNSGFSPVQETVQLSDPQSQNGATKVSMPEAAKTAYSHPPKDFSKVAVQPKGHSAPSNLLNVAILASSSSNHQNGVTRAHLQESAQPSICRPSESVLRGPISDDAVAIIGLGCRTPGADNQREFWRVLERKENHVGDVPKDRWNAAAYLDPNHTKGKAYVQKGGFLKDVRGFDNLLYSISEFEAAQMDPQQCVLLECTSMALEDAGITRKKLAGSNTGVYVGAMHQDYGSTFVGQVSKGDEYTASGITNTILASRLSYIFDLRGPCMVLDTACSVSMVAIHQGCLALRSGDCDMAICGGVNCMLTPHIFLLLCEARMVSPTGQCHAFSKNADGYARSEGCGVIILKRLKDALRDGDKIWATLNTGTNQDGRTVSPMLQPSGEQQLRLLRHVYDTHRIDVRKLDYIEAHGTGTPAGDPVEANALGTFLKEKGQKKTVYMGSLKTNIGHTEAAAGVLGVIKIVLMMKHGKIVPSLLCEEVNPKINLPDLKLAIPQSLVPWESTNKIAGCNSFGFGGSNAHAVVQAYNSQSHGHTATTTSQATSSYSAVCFSGKTEKALKGSLKEFLEDEQVPMLRLSDLAYTSTKRRDHYSFRAAIVAQDMTDLLAAVRDRLLENQPSSAVHGPPRVVFVFCGMGTAWNGMCRGLLKEMPVFKEAMMEVDKHLKTHVSWSLVERLMEENPCDDTVLSSLAIFACQVALTALWTNLGVQPYSILGQSIGEVAAAYAAGCISLTDAVSIVYYRSVLLSGVSGNGAMVVVKNVEVSKVQQLLVDLKEPKVSIALIYSPVACAVSADTGTMERVKPHLQARLQLKNPNMKLIPLTVSVAYHSPHVADAAEKLNHKIKQITSSAPKTMFISTVTGKVVTKQLDVDHWANNVKEPVLFHQSMIAAVPDEEFPKTIFLEIGPKPVAQAHMADLFPGKSYPVIPSVSASAEMKVFTEAVATLYEHGVDLDWDNYPTCGTQLTDVPRYCFDKSDKRERTELEIAHCGGYDLFGKRHLFVFAVRGQENSFRLLLSPFTICSIRQHMVMGRNVIPGALYAESGLAIARYMHWPQIVVSVNFHQLLALHKDEVTEAEITLQNPEAPFQGGEVLFDVSRKGQLLATITLSKYHGCAGERVNVKLLRSKLKQKATKERIRSMLKRLGFEHGPALSLLADGVTDFKEECLTTMQLSDLDKSELQDTVMHPSIIDNMLQSTVLPSAESLTSTKRVLPKSIGGLVVHGKFEEKMYVHTKLKSQGPKHLSFELKLLSMQGLLIAEIADFTLQVFASSQQETEQGLPAMVTYQWSKMKDTGTKWKGKNGPPDTKQKLLVISEREATNNDLTAFIKLDFVKGIESFEKEFRSRCQSESPTAIMILAPECKTELEEASVIQSKLTFLCLLIQCVFNALTERDVQSRISVTVLTVNALPSRSGNDDRDVSPLASALWGLLRVALFEHAYTDFRVAELQAPSSTALCQSANSLYELQNLLSDEKVAGFPEVLVTEDAVFVNQIVTDTSITEVPTQRQSYHVDIKDVTERVVLVSQNVADLIKLQAISVASPPLNDQQQIAVKVESFAQPPAKLMNVTISSQFLCPVKSSGYVVKAVEVSGYQAGKKDAKLACCSLLGVGPEVLVSKETAVSTACIPEYQVGDLSKLILLWTLKNRIQGDQKYTILASQGSSHIAQVVSSLHCGSNGSIHIEADIVLIEEIQESTAFNPCLLSLVLMDVATMSMLAKCWKNAHTLITFSSLFNTDVQAFLAHTLPETKLDLVNAQLVFQLAQLKTTIPQLRAFLESSKIIHAIVKCLHQDISTDDDSDIQAMLQFRTFSLQNLDVEMSNDQLFLRKGIYIVVGGLTGLGWVCVSFLAENNAGHVAILNRRPADDKQMANMKAISERYGCSVEAFQADISNIGTLEKAFDQIKSRWTGEGEIRGVFNAAVVYRDNAFPLMERSVFEEVLTPKVQGACNLHALTRNLHLDYFVMHSSVTSVLGNQGQANYAAGNAFMDGLIFHRRHLGLAGQTINWGPLNIGVIADNVTLKEKMEAMGFPLASQDNIKETLRVLLLLNKAQAVPMAINQERFAKYISATAPMPLKKRLQLLLSIPLVDDDQENQVQDISKVKLLEPEQRRFKYEQFLSSLVARVLGVDPSMVTSKVNLKYLGLNSVTAMTLISMTERSTTFRLSPMDFLSDDVTVHSLAISLDSHAKGAVKT